jgi:hypothetical protein
MGATQLVMILQFLIPSSSAIFSVFCKVFHVATYLTKPTDCYNFREPAGRCGLRDICLFATVPLLAIKQVALATGFCQASFLRLSKTLRNYKPSF